MDDEGINSRSSPLKKLRWDSDAETTSASLADVESPNSDHGDENDEDDDMYYDDDDGDYDDNFPFADNDDEVVDNYDYLQAQFDKSDLPSGVEASFSLPDQKTTASSSKVMMITPPTDEQASSWITAVKLLEGLGKESHIDQEEILRKYKEFKAFDVVDDFPDHHYKSKVGFAAPTKQWTKKVQEEWRILEKDLPETIFARACESRLDLMRAAMAGPQGTPYHDGLFMFDIHFPPIYPQVPPLVSYHSGGLRINPNLYNSGKVCLSLLNTWTGHGCEKWQPGRSTMLQVLVSIQALILNDKPYFNEPGYETRFTGTDGQENCIAYSENILLLSLKTMLYTINRPPKHFQDLVVGHFCVVAHDILAACKAYLTGAPIGSVVKGEFPVEKKINKLRSQVLFNIDLAKMMNTLIPIFAKCGAKDCGQFLVQM